MMWSRKARVQALVAIGFSLGGLAAFGAEASPNRAHWECVPYAREISGIQIHGNAHTWWSQAAGKYQRGRTPKVGAVMSFRSFGSMRLGHVAMVSAIVDDRTVKLTHANWSRINGRRGQVERNVTAIDVSEAGDWSRVKVWYAPLGGLGTTSYPINGFIYPGDAPAFEQPALPKVIFASAQQPANAFAAVKPDAIKLSIKFADAKPTGRLDNLGALLRKLQKSESN